MSSSLLLGNFDVLDPTSPVLLAPGFDRGAPVPTVSQIQSTVLDGAAVTGRAASNRRIVLPLLIRASDRVTMATLTNQILSCVDQATWPLTFTPDGGFPVVYDCYRASVAVTSDLIQDADGWQAVTVSCEALPYGRSPTPQTVVLSGTSTQVEGFNATPEPVTVSALLGTVTLTARATSPAYEGAGSLEVDYVSGGTQLQATNSAALSVAVASALSVASIQVQVPAAVSLTATGNWTLTLTTDSGTFTKNQSSGQLPGNGAWAAVSFDMSAIPVGATITGWTLTTPTIRQTSTTPATKVSFAYTGAVQTFTVPANVYSVVVDLSGAGSYARYGGRVKGVLPATPGDVWNVYVGGAGTRSNSGATGAAGGYNGAGAGGAGVGGGLGGGGGGGASDIRIGGTAVTFRRVLAGGAGGFGNGPSGLQRPGGNGGGTTGQTGTDQGAPNALAGTGGTQTGPGSGGLGSTGTFAIGYNGADGAASNGVGGAGGAGLSGIGHGGGGGGGGYWSGGGGGGSGGNQYAAGGGAGSNYVGGLSTVTSNTQGGGSTTNGSISISYQTTDKIYFDDLRVLPAAVGGIADAYGGTYTLPGILGTARTPINVALTKGAGTFGGWVVHTPPADPPTAQELIPLGGASGTNYTTAATVRYNGTYSVWLAGGTFAGGAVSRTWTVTATQSLPASGPSTSTTLTLTPTANNQLYYVGEITLPITNYPTEASVTTTITVTSTQAADTFLDVLLLDTRGQTIVVDNTATAQAAAWIDEPAPTQAFGGVWSGNDRTAATSLTSKLLAGSALIQNPGASQVLLYSPSGALSATVTYSPRWLQEATS